jgi:arabinose-5-phosphate isomerase
MSQTETVPRQRSDRAADGPAAGRDLDAARRVLKLEAEGVAALASSLDGAFIRALDILAAVKGRVVVSGMGKSGHVARKIAATLASTGTPAHFVHPAEASHGDLGMIAASDAVLALSNSGETPELADIVQYVKRFEIPLIGMCGRRESALADAATVALIIPSSPEACPLGLAPTTSTTVMLALGDALAVALLERRGFSSDNFQVFHPGGKLGRRLVKVADLMHRGDEMPLVPLGTRMADAILVITQKTFGCVGITDSRSRLVGVVTDGDLRRHMSADLLARPVDTVMSRAPKTVSAGTLASEALRIMNEKAITCLFVVDDGLPTGVLRMHDCLQAGVA